MCAAAGDEQQLQELQALLRADFLQEVAHTRATQRLNDATQNSDASLQFAWETIQEQKREVVRLRAENEALRARSSSSASRLVGSKDHHSLSTASLATADDPKRAIYALRAELATHQDANVSILHDYITRLEDALRRSTAGASLFATAATAAPPIRPFASSRIGDSDGDTSGDGKENWRPRFASSSASGVRTREDFAASQPVPSRRVCETCKRSAAAAIALQSEVKQLRAQVAADDDALVQSEQMQQHLTRETAALTSALVSAKQQQQELRELVLQSSRAKQQLQTEHDAAHRASERTVRLLQDERLELRASSSSSTSLSSSRLDRSQRVRQTGLTDDVDSVAQANAALRDRIAQLQGDVQDADARARERSSQVDALHDTIERLQHERERLRLSEDEARETASALKSKLQALTQELQEARESTHELKQALAAREQTLEARDAALEQDKQREVVEREKRRLNHERLAQARDECTRLTAQLETATERLETAEQALAQERTSTARVTRELRDSETQRQALEARMSASVAFQRELDSVQTSAAARTAAADALQQELTAAQTTILMWMSKYNALTEHVKRLEDTEAAASEARYSLERELEHQRSLVVEHQQRHATAAKAFDAQQVRSQAFEARIAELEAATYKHERQTQALETDLSQSRRSNASELAELRAAALELESRVSVLTDANRTLTHNLQSEERQRKTLGFLVQTLQERPGLQQRALREMLASSERHIIETLTHVGHRVKGLSAKLIAAERTCDALRTQLEQQQRCADGTNATMSLNSVAIADDAAEVEKSSAMMLARCQDVCRLIRAVAATLPYESLVETESDAAFLELAERVLVHAMHSAARLLTAPPPLALAHAPSVSGVSQTLALAAPQPPSSSSVLARPALDASSQTSSSVSSSRRRAVVYLKWRNVLVALRLQHQLARKHVAYTRMVAKWMRAARQCAVLDKRVKRAQWRCLALGATARVQQSELAVLRSAKQHWRWHAMRFRLETLMRRRAAMLLHARIATQQQRYSRLQKLLGFTSWRYESKIAALTQALETQQQAPALSPVSAVALGNCVRLLQQFCDDTETPADVGASCSSLTAFLIESNRKVAGWRRTLDRKIHEFRDGKAQLVRLKQRCNEMHELVALHETLVRELERKAASHEAIIEAATSFARAYRTLRTSVASQMFTTTEFYAACKRVVEAVSASSSVAVASASIRSSSSRAVASAQAATLLTSEASGATRTVSVATARAPSSSHSTSRRTRLATLDEQRELTMSRVSSTSTLRASATSVQTNNDAQRREANRSNIAILEHAVGSLRSATDVRAALERALVDKTERLALAHAQLERKRVQFAMLRLFMRWKCATYALRLQEQAVQAVAE